MWIDVLLFYIGLVLCVVWGIVRDQRDGAAFWHREFVRWTCQYQRLSMRFYGRPLLQVVHDEVIVERSWDDVPEIRHPQD